MSNTDEKKDYSSISLTRMDLNLNSQDKKIAGQHFNWLDKKLKRMRKLSYESWILAKQGVMFGVIIGSCMGLIFGGFEAVKQRKFVLLPLSMLSFSCFFGGIFGVSTIIRMEGEGEELSYDVLVFDENEKCYKYRKLDYFKKNHGNGKNYLDI